MDWIWFWRGEEGEKVGEGITFNPLYRALNVLYVIFCIYKNKLARNSIYQFISMLNTSLKIVVCFLWNSLKHIKSVSTVFWLLNHVFSVRYPAFCIFFFLIENWEQELVYSMLKCWLLKWFHWSLMLVARINIYSGLNTGSKNEFTPG